MNDAMQEIEDLSERGADIEGAVSGVCRELHQLIVGETGVGFPMRPDASPEDVLKRTISTLQWYRNLRRMNAPPPRRTRPSKDGY